MGRSRLTFLLGMLVAALALSGPAEAARRKPKAASTRKGKTKTPRKPARAATAPAVPAPPEDYGPPAPPPVPLERAAGTCVAYEPGQYLVVAEVDAQGHLFWIDERTLVETSDLRLGERVRVLWSAGRDGPVARKVMAGPTPVPRP